MPKAKGQYQLPFNTPFKEIEHVLAACHKQCAGVSKAAIRKLLRIGDRTLQYKKYALFWTGWIAQEEGKFLITDLGSSFLRGDEGTKRHILWRRIKRYPPYHRPLKLAHQEGRSILTQEFVQRVWRRDFSKQILWDVNPQRFERAPKFFVEICRVAGLGSTISEEGALALEINGTALRKYIGRSQSVFIGHGHNRQVLKKVIHFIEDTCGLNAIVVQSLPDRFRHILTKVREYLEKADYGIFLFTADDHLVSGEKRARPNVGLELIMAAALQMNVSMLVQKEVTLPSNLQGIVVKYFVRNKVEHIFLELRREMRDAGLDC